ncbi:hypothetical protein GUY44_12120 [Pimelobacter simplex]|uniref:Uncharacterized protein n=1 Tax=Nocardioides simplex TaxID=2045 RepID=A0A0A1DLB5_NOCSI|nr:hypothetical protein [Pimelobacter simplex]AIY16165.1 hypothetical protein KR76_04235 [Pimelobacter simplex]MCG8151229.1 hypothetical protein [Pimelobacter simplex]
MRFEDAKHRADGRAAHIADLVAAGRPVEQHWIDGYVSAREAREEAHLAHIVAAQELALVSGLSFIAKAVSP